MGHLGVALKPGPGAADDSLCRPPGSMGEGWEGSGLGQAGLGMGALSGGEGGQAPADWGDPQAERDQIKMNLPTL